MFNPRPILLMNGLILLILSAAMLIPALVDLLSHHSDWKVFLISAFLTAFVGGSLYFSNYGYKGGLSIRQTFLFTASSWFIVPLFGALPLWFSGLGISFTDAYFESVSGLTTTGSTVLIGLDQAPPGLLLWRGLLQGLGGVGVIVLAIAILPMLRIGGMQLFRTESSDRTDKILPRARQIASAVGYTYLTMVGICALLYWSLGMSGFDAVCHALTTISTGGFSTHDASFGYFDNVAMEMVCMLGMLAGGMPIVLFYQVFRGNPQSLFKDPQVHWFLGIVGVSILMLGYWAMFTQNLHIGDALRHSAFTVISIITTTGFASTDYALWGSGATMLIFMLSSVGGCTGSTSGGIKIFRFMVLYQTALAQLHQLIQPHGVFVPRYNRKPISESVSESVLGFFTLYAFCFFVLAILLSAFGIDYITSMSSVAQAMANVGPGLGEIVGPAGNFSSLPDGAKWLLAFAMVLGRLELFTILVLFTVRFWKD